MSRPTPTNLQGMNYAADLKRILLRDKPALPWEHLLYGCTLALVVVFGLLALMHGSCR